MPVSDGPDWHPYGRSVAIHRFGDSWRDDRGNRYRIENGVVHHVPPPPISQAMPADVADVLSAQNPATDLDRAIALIVDRLRSGGALFACGNGGSDAHAGHLVAELVGRYAYDRPPLRAIHLTSGGPVGSCIANDYGWELVFQRQVLALCGDCRGEDGDSHGADVLVCFTTSGRSRNVLEAAFCAWSHGAGVVVLTGPEPLAFAALETAAAEPGRPSLVIVRSTAIGTPAIQEEHQRQIHEVARRVEEALCPR